MPEFEIIRETEAEGGWSFQVRIGAGAGGEPGFHTLRLSWADYDLWSADGADAPHAVARAVMGFLLSRMAEADLAPTIDASTARRRFADADEEIPKRIK